ncbi:hypothetical protein [Mycobacterium avium]|uniref:hypothetical protein n=1 Tax=Mycobacterium avium TaxID=1764 RepID=UPI0002A6C5B3|nr:hypothetical protein [Mycobacterium avium]ELP48264.1 hypothetical protein D522_00621 [Mycobacterium avium subsp. paratuberculosis S5]ETA97401.1 hypothetical protein O979_20345 [Mycobacterium avium subsp. paratuberculosis 10-4404]ETB00021.1 hypothetical protein O978_20400 [Mycobacterium avium subsp. paratuberculosis 10-5864]ETB09216.1 hypothetical protein O980_20010 [Mycobacterium avium subsp. paratuberculosis 08-8281]ETB27540.1 hypothetical protein O977_21835 [Mycobacterium avium subsp. par
MVRLMAHRVRLFGTASANLWPRIGLRRGLATLVAGVDDGEDRVRFTLTGAAFGKRVEGQETDPPAVWMRLVVLGVKFREAYGVDARVTDPDVEGTGSGDASPAPVS